MHDVGHRGRTPRPVRACGTWPARRGHTATGVRDAHAGVDWNRWGIWRKIVRRSCRDGSRAVRRRRQIAREHRGRSSGVPGAPRHPRRHADPIGIADHMSVHNEAMNEAAATARAPSTIPGSESAGNRGSSATRLPSIAVSMATAETHSSASPSSAARRAH